MCETVLRASAPAQNHELRAAIRRIAFLGFFQALGFGFAEAGGRDHFRADAVLLKQILAGRNGATLPKREIVAVRAALIAMTLDDELNPLVALEVSCDGVQFSLLARLDGGAVKFEVDRLRCKSCFVALRVGPGIGNSLGVCIWIDLETSAANGGTHVTSARTHLLIGDGRDVFRVSC